MASSKSDEKFLKPTKFMEVEAIANELISGVSVVVDLTETEIAEAKRICDFLNGVTYALNGEVRKIAKLIYYFGVNSK